jgi:hypothetical protein
MAAKTAIVKNIKGVTFMGKADSNHWVFLWMAPKILEEAMLERAQKN